MIKQEKKKRKRRANINSTTCLCPEYTGETQQKESLPETATPSAWTPSSAKNEDVEVGVPRKSSGTRKWPPLQSRAPPSQVMSVSCDCEPSAAQRREAHDKRRLPHKSEPSSGGLLGCQSFSCVCLSSDSQSHPGA